MITETYGSSDAQFHESAMTMNKSSFAFRHDNKNNNVFIDGHAESRKRLEVPCVISYPSFSLQALFNTYYNSGDVDPTLDTVMGL